MAVRFAIQMRNQIVAALMNFPGNTQISSFIDGQDRSADHDDRCQHCRKYDRPQEISHTGVSFTSGLTRSTPLISAWP